MALINVIPGPKARDGEVVLWEKDNPEPGMEIYLAKVHPGQEKKQKYARVEQTPLVSQKIGQGILIEGTGEGGEYQPISSADESPLLPDPEPMPTPLASEVEPKWPLQTESKLNFLTEKQRENLAAAGFRSDEEIMTATDEELNKAEGVGEATIKGIREASRE